MGISVYSHAWRAVVLAWGMAWFGPAADLSAGTLDTTASVEPAGRSDECRVSSWEPISPGAGNEANKRRKRAPDVESKTYSW